MSDKDRSASKQTDRSDEITAPTISSDIADLKAAMAEMMCSFKTEIFAHVSDSISGLSGFSASSRTNDSGRLACCCCACSIARTKRR